MAGLNQEIFDEFVAGTGSTWYSPASLNNALGADDGLLVVATVTNVAGTSPSLSVFFDSSGDNQNWVLGTAPDLVVGPPMTERAMAQASAKQLNGFLRMRVTLGGTSPQCRLRLWVTGRS